MTGPNGTGGPTGINLYGTLVGNYHHQFSAIRRDRIRVFKDIDVPGYQSTVVMGINGYGTITGSTLTSQGVVVGFSGTNCQ